MRHISLRESSAALIVARDRRPHVGHTPRGTMGRFRRMRPDTSVDRAEQPG
jgi:hypothetical protein